MSKYWEDLLKQIEAEKEELSPVMRKYIEDRKERYKQEAIAWLMKRSEPARKERARKKAQEIRKTPSQPKVTKHHKNL